MTSSRDPRTAWSADRSVRVGARFFRFLWSRTRTPGAVRLFKNKFGPGADRTASLGPRTDRLWCDGWRHRRPKSKRNIFTRITSNRIKLAIYSYEKVIFSFLVKTIEFLEFWSKIRILIKTAELVQQGVYLTPAGLRKKLIRYRQYTHGYVRNWKYYIILHLPCDITWRHII